MMGLLWSERRHFYFHLIDKTSTPKLVKSPNSFDVLNLPKRADLSHTLTS